MLKFFSLPRLIILLASLYSTFAFATLNTSINALLNKENSDEQIGIYVQNADTGMTLYNSGGSSPMTPASNTKVFTSAAAYLYLGPNYRYATSISSQAPISSTLKGNLYVNFSGDPTLRSLDISNLMRALQQKGVQQIDGNVIVDQGVFNGPYYGLGWPQNDLSYCYAAPISGAIINGNCMSLKITKTPGHETPIVKQYTTNFPIVNQLRLVSKSVLRGCVFQPYITSSNTIVLQGCVPARGDWSIAFAIKNPDIYARQVVAASLQRAGVRVNGKIIDGTTPANVNTLAIHYSNPLQNILSYMLKHSDNIYAGAISKTLGDSYYGVGSYKSGVNAINATLTTHIGQAFRPVYLEDGAGLSVYNMVSPKQLVQVLSYMYNQPNLSKTFMNSLAISGHTGTLSYRMSKPPLFGHVYGKTGTINGVSTLAGYIAIPGHPTVTFAIMMNRITGSPAHARYIQDRIVQTIAANI